MVPELAHLTSSELERAELKSFRIITKLFAIKTREGLKQTDTMLQWCTNLTRNRVNSLLSYNLLQGVLDFFSNLRICSLQKNQHIKSTKIPVHNHMPQPWKSIPPEY